MKPERSHKNGSSDEEHPIVIVKDHLEGNLIVTRLQKIYSASDDRINRHLKALRFLKGKNLNSLLKNRGLQRLKTL